MNDMPEQSVASASPRTLVRTHSADSIVTSSILDLMKGGRSEARDTSAAVDAFVCTVPGCEKKFERRYNLAVHMRRHTGETPYTCLVPGCLKKFKWRSSMAHHNKSHERTGQIRVKLPIVQDKNLINHHRRAARADRLARNAALFAAVNSDSPLHSATPIGSSPTSASSLLPNTISDSAAANRADNRDASTATNEVHGLQLPTGFEHASSMLYDVDSPFFHGAPDLNVDFQTLVSPRLRSASEKRKASPRVRCPRTPRKSASPIIKVEDLSPCSVSQFSHASPSAGALQASTSRRALAAQAVAQAALNAASKASSNDFPAALEEVARAFFEADRAAVEGCEEAMGTPNASSNTGMFVGQRLSPQPQLGDVKLDSYPQMLDFRAGLDTEQSLAGFFETSGTDAAPMSASRMAVEDHSSGFTPKVDTSELQLSMSHKDIPMEASEPKPVTYPAAGSPETILSQSIDGDDESFDKLNASNAAEEYEALCSKLVEMQDGCNTLQSSSGEQEIQSFQKELSVEKTSSPKSSDDVFLF